MKNRPDQRSASPGLWRTRVSATSRHALRYVRKPIHLQTVMFLAAAFVTALLSVFFSQSFKYGEAFFQSFRLDHPVGVWAWTPLCFAASWYLIWRFAPTAGGSGIPQVLAAKDANPIRDKPLVERLLSIRVIVVKVFSAILNVSGGGAIGREGPTLQIGSSVFKVFHRWTDPKHPTANQDLWIIAGAATGLAAAFNTPLGGIVFAIEELRLPSFHRFRAVLLSSIIVGGLVSQWLIGSYLYLGMPKIENPDFIVFPFALAVGIAGGLVGGFFGRLLEWGLALKGDARHFKRGLLWALGCGLAVVALGRLADVSYGSGSVLMNNLLFHGQQGDATSVGLRTGSMTLSYLVGGSGGIFAPSLAAGACLGSWMGILFHGVTSNLMVILGMIAFLTGVTRTPFTAFVLVLEMTDRHSAIFPMMVAALAANAAARFIQRRSFYEVMRERIVAEDRRNRASLAGKTPSIKP